MIHLEILLFHVEKFNRRMIQQLGELELEHVGAARVYVLGVGDEEVEPGGIGKGRRHVHDLRSPSGLLADPERHGCAFSARRQYDVGPRRRQGGGALRFDLVQRRSPDSKVISVETGELEGLDFVGPAHCAGDGEKLDIVADHMGSQHPNERRASR